MSIVKCNQKNFDSEVLNEKGKVLVDFNATWCGPCKMMGPIVEELSSEIKNVKFISIDTDEEDELSQEYAVMSIPCFVLFENGKEINRVFGSMPKEGLIDFIGE